MRGSALVLALLASCTSAPSEREPEAVKAAPASEARAEPALPSGPEDAQSPCVKTCLQHSQMQARAWEAIVADCRRDCAARPTP